MDHRWGNLGPFFLPAVGSHGAAETRRSECPLTPPPVLTTWLAQTRVRCAMPTAQMLHIEKWKVLHNWVTVSWFYLNNAEKGKPWGIFWGGETESICPYRNTRGWFSWALHFQSSTLLLAGEKLLIHQLVPRHTLTIIHIALVISPPSYIFFISVAIWVGLCQLLCLSLSA